MEDDDDKDDTKRKSRNLSEKKRRDQFNLLVNELSTMVSSNARKMDKSTVLKSTISFLKNHNEVATKSRVHEIQENWKPAFLPNEEFTHLILEALDGFIIVFSSSGKIHYTSEGITSLLGHLPSDLLHMTIYDMVYEEEQQKIYNILLNPPKTVIDPLQSSIAPENQVSFLCHVKRGSMETPPKVSYEFVQFTGYFRENVDIENTMQSSRYNSYSGDADSRTLFLGTGRLMTPQLVREMSIVDTKSEFSSRHSLEWKFLFLDHRAPPIIGYLPFEVLGTSGYDYYHFDDLERVVTCHEALIQKGKGTSCFYRFLTKGQQWIWLQTRFYITYHQWNSKPEFIACTHRVVSYADVMKHMRRNNGSSFEALDDNDSMIEDGKAQASTSNLMVMSPWSSKSSRASKNFAQTQESPSVKLKRSHSYRHDSDSTSMSADSPVSHHSMLTQNSSVSQRSRSKHSVKMSKTAASLQVQPHSHFSQFNSPQPQPSGSSSHQLHSINSPPSQPMTFAPPKTAQTAPHHHRVPLSAQVIGTPFANQSQFLSVIPVQPAFSSNASMTQPASEYANPNVELAPAQSHLQSDLLRKNEELEKLVAQTQGELRRVSEQLFITRYGIIPSVVNVSVPYVIPMDQTDAGENLRTIPSISHITHPSYIEQHPHAMPHPQISHMVQPNPIIHVHQPTQNHLMNQYELTLQKQNSSDQSIQSAQQNEDILQYMQHQSQTSSSHHMSQSMHHQQQNHNDDFGLMPFQMLNQQAQILFSSGNANEGANHSSNNK